MKILLLDQFSELGGGQQALLDTVDAVQQRGWGPHVLVPGRGPLVEALQSRAVPVGGIASGPYGLGTKSVADSIRFALDLRQQMRVISDVVASANIDLIYVNGPRLLPAVALAERRTPVVVHLHSHLRGSALQLTRWSIRRASATVIGCSNSVLAPLRVDKPHVIPNGVRDAGFRERSERWRIGIVGRIAPEKGQMELVNAAAILKAEFPRAHFVICGAPLFGAHNDYSASVHQRAHNLPVEFIAWQPDVGRVLNDLDLLAVPSLQEGMGRIVLEAFSAGLPVIAFPAGGIPEAVIDGETGFLTTHLSAAALADRIRDVMALDSACLQRVAWNARKAWERSYTIDAYEKHIIGLLETLVPVLPEERAAEMPLQHR